MPGRKAIAGKKKAGKAAAKKAATKKVAANKAAANKAAANKVTSKRAATGRPATIPEYIAQAPPESRKHLRELYAILKRAAPGAAEAIKWKVPVFEEGRIL